MHLALVTTTAKGMLTSLTIILFVLLGYGHAYKYPGRVPSPRQVLRVTTTIREQSRTTGTSTRAYVIRSALPATVIPIITIPTQALTKSVPLMTSIITVTQQSIVYDTEYETEWVTVTMPKIAVPMNLLMGTTCTPQDSTDESQQEELSVLVSEKEDGEGDSYFYF